MEQTLGKRIIENRKRLGLTQDRLAEQLGVTAQAVSKWENDQSCPDITTLPKLAEIFGTTTDALLGIRQPEKVHDAEVITEEPAGGLRIDNNDGKWEFQYDGGQKAGIALALWIILSGGLLLASNILGWNAELWSVFWPSGLLLFGLFGLYPEFSAFRLGCALFGGYFLLTNLNIGAFSLGKEYILPIILLLFGLSVLIDALKNKKKPGFTISHNGKTIHRGSKKIVSNFSEVDEEVTCEVAFAHDTRYITLPRLALADIDVAFGELTVDFTGVKEFTEFCSVNADCSFGNLILILPKTCQVKPSTDTAFASVSFRGSPDENPVSNLKLDCDVAFGQVQIRYV